MGVVARTSLCVAVGGALVVSLFVTSAPASAQSALLDPLANRVTIAQPGGVPNEIAVEQMIRSGDTIATDDTGRAVITYPDGSTALLEENSALTIEFVQTSAGDYAVRMQQTIGRVWYAVTSAMSSGSRYEVRSTGIASVIRAGSDSYVIVSPEGETTVMTISGTVDTSAGGVEVSVPAGSSTTVSGPGATPVPVRAAPVLAQPATSTPSPNAPAPSTATPNAPTPTPGRIPAPSPTNAFVPAVTTLPPLPVMSATPKAKLSPPTWPLPTAKPTAAPAPAPLKDRFGPRKDAAGPPSPKLKPL